MIGFSKGASTTMLLYTRNVCVVDEHIAYADLQDQDQINRGFTDVTNLRAALQPKDGNQ